MGKFIDEVKIFDNIENYDEVIDYPDGVLFFITQDKNKQFNLVDEYQSHGNSEFQKMGQKVLAEKYPNLQIPKGKTLTCVLLCPEFRRIVKTYTKERMFVALFEDGEYYCDMPVAHKINEFEDIGGIKQRFIGLKDGKRIELRTKLYHTYYQMYLYNTWDIWQESKDFVFLLQDYPSSKFRDWVLDEQNQLALAYDTVLRGAKIHLRRLDFSRPEKIWQKQLAKSKYDDVILKIINNEEYKDFIWDKVKPTKPKYFLETIRKE